MAAVLLSNPGLPLAVLGNPRRRRSKRKNPMTRTPRFFLRRFKRGKRNPYMGAVFGIPTEDQARVGKKNRTVVRWYKKGRTIADVRAMYAARGLHPPYIFESTGTRRRKARKARRSYHKKARRGHRKTTVSKKTRRSRARRMARSALSHLIGKVFKRKVRGKRYAVKILGRRKGRGKKRKVLAVRWSGKRGSRIFHALSFGSRRRKGTHVIGFTNPRRRKHRSRRTRRNPGIAGEYVGGLTSAPSKIMGLFKGSGAVKNGLFAAGGAVGTFMIGGILSAKLVRPLLEKVAPALAARVADPSSIEARVVGGLLPYTAAFAITKLVGNKLGGDISKALLLGGAVASAIELIRPGMVGDLLRKAGLGEMPGGTMLAGLGALGGPVCGLGYSDMLAGYETAPAYSGTAGYVEAAAYSGTAGYVEAAAYQGSAGMGSEQLAGTYLDDASNNILENNWL
jgi:hypothetical protein